MRIRTNTITLCGLLLIASCKQINKSFQDTIHPRPEKGDTQTVSSAFSGGITDSTIRPQEKHYSSIFESAEKLDRIQAALLDLPQFKGKQIKLYQSLDFYDYQGGRISIKIQNPDTTENIDNYIYQDGKWQDPVPVKITGNVGFMSFLMPVDRIRFSTAKKVYDQTTAKGKDVQGAKEVQFVDFSYMKYGSHDRERAYWFTAVEGVRNDYSLDFDIDGNLTEMKPR